MKSVLISIQPKWVEKIANGEKTIEVRKTAPKCGLPFKAYIYCTKSIRAHVFHMYINGGIGRQEFGIIGLWRSGKKVVEVNPRLPAYRYNSYLAEGKVIGECIIDKIDEIVPDYNPATAKFYYGYVVDTAATCLSEEELQKYGKNKSLYFWHISDLKIYDKPKELSEFYTKKTCNSCKKSGYESTACMYDEDCKVPMPITRAPQSWQYVEELEE